MEKFNTQQAKKELRRSLLKKRQSMSITEWREKSDRICNNLLPMLNQVKTVLAYFSFRQEPDLSFLWDKIPLYWGFPRCLGDSLGWHIWTPNDKLTIGNYGILEPYPEAATVNPEAVDLIIIPCVACDYHGYRLGYGGGYYDRLLSSPIWANKTTVGMVFEFAYLPQLPVELWDQPLKAICTEVGLQIKN